MAEQHKQIVNNATLTKRYSTATVKAKILDTERLNHMGLDMSQWRCKDLANFQFFKESAIDTCDGRNLNCVSPSTSDSAASVISVTSNPSSPLPLKGFARLRSRLLNMGCSGSNTVKRTNSINTSSNNYQSKSSNGEEFQSQTPVPNNVVTKNYSEMRQEKKGGKAKSNFTSEKPKRNYRESKFEDNKSSLTGHEDVDRFDNIIASTSNKTNENQSDNSVGWLSFIHFSQGDANNIVNKAETQRMNKLHKCHSCGKQFGTAGFKIHQSRCIQVKFDFTHREQKCNYF